MSVPINKKEQSWLRG